MRTPLLCIFREIIFINVVVTFLTIDLIEPVGASDRVEKVEAEVTIFRQRAANFGRRRL